MIQTNLLNATQVRKIVAQNGMFSVLEYDHDVSVTADSAMRAYYAAQMNVRKRQLIAQLNNSAVVVQAGAMQLMIGGINAAADIKGAGDLLKKAVGSKMTGETAIKPRYEGSGTLVLEPTYRHIILEDLANWGGQIVIEDGLFLACESTVNLSVVARSNLSSAVLGGEGLFNCALFGNGVIALESPVPASEIIVVDLNNDQLKIDGNMAIAWSAGLQFTVEKTTKSLLGSAASGEGFVNVYRGTGRVMIAPVC